MRLLLSLLLLTLTALVSVLVALQFGSIALNPNETWALLSGDLQALPEATRMVITELRWPRAITAFCVGGALALAGVLMQVLLRNPLADPYILGVSGGASVVALLILFLGLSADWLAFGAFSGALLSMLLVFGFAWLTNNAAPLRLLLIGVVVAAGWGATINLLLALSRDTSVHAMLFWLMGDLSHSTGPAALAWLLPIGLLISMALARPLNLLMRGEISAASLGVNVPVLRGFLLLLASLLTGASVTLAGSIGFVGLLVPHLMRLILGADHRALLPAAVLAGGGLLVLADTLARTVIAPQQLPVGVITALLGVPVFLWMLWRERA